MPETIALSMVDPWTQAWEEAEASADVVACSTLELQHPTFEAPVYIVRRGPIEAERVR